MAPGDPSRRTLRAAPLSLDNDSMGPNSQGRVTSERTKSAARCAAPGFAFGGAARHVWRRICAKLARPPEAGTCAPTLMRLRIWNQVYKVEYCASLESHCWWG